MATQYITRIGMLSLGMISGVASAIIGLIMGAFVLLWLPWQDGGAFGWIFGVGAIIALPIFYAVFGFVSGVISAIIYNVAIGFVGGLEVDIE